MVSRGYPVLAAILVMAVILTAQGAAAQTTYTITVATDMPSYVTGQTIKVTGTVSPAPGPSTAVFVKVLNPAGKVVTVGDSPVGATTGAYNFTLVAGGTADWTTGTYKVNATWGAYPPTIFHTATFAYTASVTTTTTSTSTTNTSSSTTSTNSTSTTSTSSTTTTTSSSTTTSTSSTGGGGGIPEFPYQATFAGVFAVLIAAAYLLARRFATRGPVLPSTR